MEEDIDKNFSNKRKIKRKALLHIILIIMLFMLFYSRSFTNDKYARNGKFWQMAFTIGYVKERNWDIFVYDKYDVRGPLLYDNNKLKGVILYCSYNSLYILSFDIAGIAFYPHN